MNKAAGNVPVRVPVWTQGFISVGLMTTSGIAGSCGRSVFNVFRNRHTVFHRGCPSLPQAVLLLANTSCAFHGSRPRGVKWLCFVSP